MPLVCGDGLVGVNVNTNYPSSIISIIFAYVLFPLIADLLYLLTECEISQSCVQPRRSSIVASSGENGVISFQFMDKLDDLGHDFLRHTPPFVLAASVIKIKKVEPFMFFGLPAGWMQYPVSEASQDCFV